MLLQNYVLSVDGMKIKYGAEGWCTTRKQTMNLMDIVFEMRLSELDDDDKIIMLEIRNTF